MLEVLIFAPLLLAAWLMVLAMVFIIAAVIWEWIWGR